MAQAAQHHITVGGRPYCDFTGCMAGLKVAEQTGVHACGHLSGRAARMAASALRTRLLCVAVVSGPCPQG